MIAVGIILVILCTIFLGASLVEDGWLKTAKILLSLVVLGVLLILAEVSIYENNKENRIVGTIITNEYSLNDDAVIRTEQPMYVEHWKENDFGYPTIIAGPDTFRVYTLEEAEELGKDIGDVRKVFVPIQE